MLICGLAGDSREWAKWHWPFRRAQRAHIQRMRCRCRAFRWESWTDFEGTLNDVPLESSWLHTEYTRIHWSRWYVSRLPSERLIHMLAMAELHHRWKTRETYVPVDVAILFLIISTSLTKPKTKIFGNSNAEIKCILRNICHPSKDLSADRFLSLFLQKVIAQSQYNNAYDILASSFG